jgi:hypothetical protein
VFNFTEKQLALLNAVKALNIAHKLWAYDGVAYGKIDDAKDSLQALLVNNIGTKIVQDGLNKETNG